MTDFVISSLGDAAQNRSTTCAVLTWDKTKLCTEVTPVLECLAGTDSGHHGSRDQRTDTGNTHETTAVSFLLTDLVDLAANGLDPLIERYPVFVEASNQVAHSWRYLVLTALQDRQEGVTVGVAIDGLIVLKNNAAARPAIDIGSRGRIG